MVFGNLGLSIKPKSRKQEGQQKIRVLYLEDNPSDVDLLEIQLSKAGEYDLTSVSKREAFLKEFEKDYDLFLLDYQLPEIDGIEALGMIKSSGLTAPVVILSGTVGEEEAVALMREGASDFLLKRNINKVHHVIKRVLREQEAFNNSQAYLEELKDKNALLDSIFNGLGDLMFFKDRTSCYMKVNMAFCEHFKMNEEFILGKRDVELFDVDITQKSEETDSQIIKYGKSIRYSTDYIAANGERVITETIKSPIISNNKVIGLVGISRDITQHRVLEEQSRKNQIILSQAEDMVNAGSFEYNTKSEILSCTPNLIKMLGLEADYNQISLTRFFKLIYESDRALFIEQFENTIRNKNKNCLIHRIQVGDELKNCRTKLKQDMSTGIMKFYGTIVEITQERNQEDNIDTVLENERKRISRELHDGIGPKLSAASMYLDQFLSKEKNDSVVKALCIVNESVNDIRSISRNLSVKMVEENGLTNAIEDLLDRIPGDIKKKVIIDIDEQHIDSFVEGHIFRIVQEAILNLKKYADATLFELSLKQEQSVLILTIRDNGKGCHIEKVLKKGNGVKNICHRVKRCNGIIRFQSEINKGFGFEIKVPTN